MVSRDEVAGLYPAHTALPIVPDNDSAIKMFVL